MSAEKTNSRYLPGFAFPDHLTVSSNLADSIANCNDILVAVPSAAFRETLTALKPLLKPDSRIIWATKGLDSVSGGLLHHAAQDILGEHVQLAALSGPTFAKEVAAGLPTAVVIASQHQSFAAELMQRFNSPIFRVYLSTDITGVEIGGIVKNVLAVATGITDGMQLGANARAALITRGLAEMIRLGIAAGGLYETFNGLAGLGDLILTCTDNQSRNKRFGLAIGSGQSAAAANADIGQVVEGQRNAPLVMQLAKKLNVDMPISETVLNILEEKMSLAEAMQSLLTRSPRQENNPLRL